MCSGEIKIINKLGLHARAATKFVQLSSKYTSQVVVNNGQRTINGKSIIGLMTLAARQGTTLFIETSGVDEKEMFNSLKNLVADKFGESA